MAESKVTVPDIIGAKKEGRKLVMVTAYDYPFGLIAEEAGVDALCINVGWHEARVPTLATSAPRRAFTWGYNPPVSTPPAPTQIAAALEKRVVGQKEAVREMAVALAFGAARRIGRSSWPGTSAS